MEETSILAPLKNPVSVHFRSWVFFKQKVLESELRKELEGTNYTKEEWETIVSRLKPQSFCSKFRTRGTKSISRETMMRYRRHLVADGYRYYQSLISKHRFLQVIETKVGLGLEIIEGKEDDANMVIKQHLWGTLFPLADPLFEKLKEKQFPSLYESEKKYGLGGPLSLLNHECNAQFAFSSPSSGSPGGRETMKLKDIREKPWKKLRIDGEITVEYHNEKEIKTGKVQIVGRNCSCKKCEQS